MSLVTIEETNVRLTAMKQSQDGDGIILRLVEVDGRATEARVTLAPELLPDNATVVAWHSSFAITTVRIT